MENLRVQSSKEIELKESKIPSGWRVMNSQEKPMKIKIVYVQAIKIERANVKIHINYCYNSNLYALFTCFVFAHHCHRCHRCRRPIIIIIPLQWTPKPMLIHCSACVWVCILCWTICLCCDHFGFTILFRCSFLGVFFYFLSLLFSLLSRSFLLSFCLVYIFYSFPALPLARWWKLHSGLSAALSSTINWWNI